MSKNVHDSLIDRHDLTFLAGLQDQQAVLANVRKMADMASSELGGNKMPEGVDVEVDDMGIQNRCPKITNNYNMAPPTLPFGWLRAAILTAVVLVLLLLAGAWLLSQRDALHAVPVPPASTSEDYNVGFFDP
jgi:hypothetical protein